MRVPAATVSAADARVRLSAAPARPKAASAAIGAWPKLDPRILVRAARSFVAPFPFDRADVRYYYLARNGIYALAEAWALAGEEVLVPAYCHGVEVRALLHAGVRPRFFPVGRGMRVTAEDVIASVTPRTRAIYLIHYVGFPGPVEELAEFCRRQGVLLIEDCALAMLSRLGDRPLGSFGDAAIFCLYKTLPLPNGGAVVATGGAPHAAGARRAPSLASTVAYTAYAALRPAPDNLDSDDRPRGRMREAAKRVLREFGLARVGGEEFEAQHLALGMSSICHRIIAAQDFDGIVEQRRRNYLHLLERLDGVASIVHPHLPDGVCPLFFAIQTPHKVELRRRLLACGIETVNLWCYEVPGVRPGEYPEVDELRSTVLELPCHQDLGPEDMDRIADWVSRQRACL